MSSAWRGSRACHGKIPSGARVGGLGGIEAGGNSKKLGSGGSEEKGMRFWFSVDHWGRTILTEGLPSSYLVFLFSTDAYLLSHLLLYLISDRIRIHDAIIARQAHWAV